MNLFIKGGILVGDGRVGYIKSEESNINVEILVSVITCSDEKEWW